MKNLRLIICLHLALMVIFAALAVRCLYLQGFKSEHFAAKAIKQRQKRLTEKPQRGAILDCCGRVLSASNRVYTIYAEPRVIKNPARIATQMSPILGIEASDIYQSIITSRNPGFAKLKMFASQQECTAAAKINNGIGVQSDWWRYYPMGRLASHVAGYVDTDGVGLDGVELKCNEILRGTAGQSICFADISKRSIRPKQMGSRLEDGSAVVLTIDATIQQFARAELEKRYREYEAESAVAIVAEPKTGAILAMVSLPDFEPNSRACDSNNLRNRAITDQFEPGSMLKPIVAAIALDQGLVNRHERIFCENGNYRGKGFGRIGEYGDHKFGNLKVREILVKSSNIGMAKIGQRFKKRQQLYEALRLFGYGKKTGIDLPGEVGGLLRPSNKWTGYSVTRIPFGQEITVTALQMVRAFCVLANGGRAVTPHVVRAVVGPEGKVIKVNRLAPPIGYVIKPEIAKWLVTDALVGVVNERKNGGTGWRAKLEKWQVFGKTGTANIALSDRPGYSDDHYVASFIAGAPVENPAVVVLVSIRKPNKRLGKGYTGGVVASPVAGRIIEKTLTYLSSR